MKKQLKGHAAAAHTNIMNDPNWKSPVQREPDMSQPLSMAQYMNQFGKPDTGDKIKAEIGGMGWVDAVVLTVDSEKDEKDPHNMGYWHNSRILCQYLVENKNKVLRTMGEFKTQWVPFSMILIEAKHS